MLLIYTDYPSFEDYISRLGKSARKNYVYAKKHNQDLTYQAVPFVREEVARFMQLWERQLIRGEYKQWAFPVEYLEGLEKNGQLRVFGADRNGDRVALHFIQKRDGYWECHPPMYDKEFGSRRYLAKFMWFNLIKFALQNGIEFLDFGGGIDNWREMIKRRNEFPNPKYKWLYVPQEVKDAPDKQPNFIIQDHALIR